MALCLQIDRDELRAGFLKLGEHLTEDDIDAIMVRKNKHALFFCATFALKKPDQFTETGSGHTYAG